MLSDQTVKYASSKMPAYVGYFGFAYYFYFKGLGPLER